MRGLRQIEQRSGQESILIVQIDAPDEVGIVLALREPSRRGAGGAVLRKREHRRATGGWRGERVGVNRNEKVRLYPARLLNAHVQWNKVVVITRQYRAHVGLSVEHADESLCDRKRDILLVGSARTDRARVLAAVARVDHDDNRPSNSRLRL